MTILKSTSTRLSRLRGINRTISSHLSRNRWSTLGCRLTANKCHLPQVEPLNTWLLKIYRNYKKILFKWEITVKTVTRHPWFSREILTMIETITKDFSPLAVWTSPSKRYHKALLIRTIRNVCRLRWVLRVKLGQLLSRLNFNRWIMMEPKQPMHQPLLKTPMVLQILKISLILYTTSTWPHLNNNTGSRWRCNNNMPTAAPLNKIRTVLIFKFRVQALVTGE